MQKEVTDKDNYSMRVIRMLTAPVNVVWKAWTNPEHIANWWGPDGFTNTIHSMDVKSGGEWLLTMHGPDGKRYPNKSEFREIEPMKKIVFQHFNPHYLATVIFEAKENKTLLEWTMQFETEELFETVVKVFKAEEGLQQNVEKLEKYIVNKLPEMLL